jgi:hypothetical protein
MDRDHGNAGRDEVAKGTLDERRVVLRDGDEGTGVEVVGNGGRVQAEVREERDTEVRCVRGVRTVKDRRRGNTEVDLHRCEEEVVRHDGVRRVHEGRKLAEEAAGKRDRLATVVQLGRGAEWLVGRDFVGG